jgi:acetyltransferase
MALVAERKDPGDGRTVILGIGRLSSSLEEGCMEFSILIGDPWQGRGLGRELLSRLVDIGRREGLSRIRGFILPENQAMQAVARKLGFDIKFSPDHQCMLATLDLAGGPSLP